MLDNYQNYGPFEQFARGYEQIIHTSDITSDNVIFYFNSLLNILKDGIDTEIVESHFIKYIFDTGDDIELSVPDSYVNIIMWSLVLYSGDRIRPEHIIFDEDFQAKQIANYINKFLIIPNRKHIVNIKLNNIIDDVLFLFKSIDKFSMYLSNTSNLKDYIDLMNENPEVYDILHCDLSPYPLEEVNVVANKLNDRLIDIIKHSNHCYRDAFKAKEAINEKQHREFAVAGGTKPNGMGGVFSGIINSNYIVNGLSNIQEFYIEETGGRTAQILSKNNVSDSGHFARLLGLNNQDTFLNKDPDYVCNTRNFIKLTISSIDMLKKYISRYYRLYPDGMEYVITGMELDLIGKTIYLRSPMTCQSYAEGNGICYRCYGDVAYTNNDINIGKIAAELLSAELTQRLLSAKHLLESAIKRLKWCEYFGEYFMLDGNLISIRDDLEDIKDRFIMIDGEIHIENEYEDIEYNQSICEFKVIDKGNIISMYTDDADDIFFSNDFLEISEKYTDDDGVITIPFSELVDINLFMIQIHNNGLQETLKQLKDIIDKSEITKRHDINSIVQSCIETVIKGNLNTDAIHCEIILANQIRLGDTPDTILEKPNWAIPNNKEYVILTLSKALNNHPSVTISLSYERIKRALYSPLTYRKTSPSYMDLFFMTNVSEIIGNKEYSNEAKYTEGMIVPAKIIQRKDSEK